MKCFYWNLRGLDNSPTKLALKNLLVKYKPDLCIIVESWMFVSHVSQRWLHNRNLKVFAVNDRNNLNPNPGVFVPLIFLLLFCPLMTNKSPFKSLLEGNLLVYSQSTPQPVTLKEDISGMLSLLFKPNTPFLGLV